MPVIHKSTIKRARQSVTRHLRNRAALSSMKNVVKKVMGAVEEKNADQAKTFLRDATASLHKAVTKGLIKPNTASRRISRLSAKVNALSAART
jgi:small subunit ribosomal protein S20